MTRADIINKIEQLCSRRDSLQEDIDALKRTVDILFPTEPAKRTGGRSYDNIPVEDLAGMGVEDAAKLIASRNDNELISTPARKLMERAGVLSGDEAGTHLYQALKDSRAFEQTGMRGHWKLVEPATSRQPIVMRAVGA